MDLDMLDRRDRDRQLEKDGLDIIDRYRRMDEWAGSFQNLYSRTALDCQRRLSDCKVGMVSAMHFLQYSRPGNHELLRLAAFDNLIQPDMFNNTPVLRYVAFCMSSDPSPWIRNSLQRFFGRILAAVAIGDHLKARNGGNTGELIVENELDAQHQQEEAARKRSIGAALAALKQDLGSNRNLQRSLWAAVNSDALMLHETQAMLDFCRMLYDPVDSFVLKIGYPRYWQQEYLGKVSENRILYSLFTAED
jgi:transcription initiation factor TFIID subunit 2